MRHRIGLTTDSPQGTVQAMLGLLKLLWRNWKGLAHRIIAAQNWLVMAIAYGVGMGPVAIIMRIKHDDLIDRGLGDPDCESYWLPMTTEQQDIRRAQRPY